jgi:hypothetical protein
MPQGGKATSHHGLGTKQGTHRRWRATKTNGNRKQQLRKKKRKTAPRKEEPADRPEQRWGDGPRCWYWADLVLLFLKAVIQRSRYPYIKGFFSAVGGFGANALWRLVQACQDSKRCPRDPAALYRYSLLVLGLRTQSRLLALAFEDLLLFDLILLPILPSFFFFDSLFLFSDRLCLFSIPRGANSYVTLARL